MRLLRFKTATLVVIGAIVAQLAGCAAGRGRETGIPDYVPSDVVLHTMTPDEARKHLQYIRDRADMLWAYDPSNPRSEWNPNNQITRIVFLPDRIDLTTKTATKRLWLMSVAMPKVYCGLNCDIRLSDQWAIKDAAYRTTYPGASSYQLEQASRLADAMYVLEHEAMTAAADEDARFSASLGAYRESASKSELPESAIKSKVQAEGAVRDKKFEDAVDLYGEALNVAPWWPQGHFNRALIFGETGEYKLAAREMKRYLLLVPDAPNPRAAQDKIYDWEREAGQNGPSY